MIQNPLIPIPGPLYPQPLLTGHLIKRYKRFLVDFETSEGRFTAHTNNSGAMLGLLRPGARIAVSRSDNPKRKLPYTLEMIELDTIGHGPSWIGVNTATPNRILHLAFHAGRLPFAQNYITFRPETNIGQSRMDGLITHPDPEIPDLWVEAKNVTLVENDIAAFPDAVTIRGQKHLLELIELVRQGYRAAIFCLVQRPDGHCFGPADYIDPDFSRLLQKAHDVGVEIHPHRALVSPHGIDLGNELPLALD